MNRECIAKVIATIEKGWENPYPKDIYLHDNPEMFDMEITWGRFNEHVYNVAENTKQDIIKLIKEMEE